MLQNVSFTLNPQINGEYKAKINVFSSLLNNIYGYSGVTKKELKEGVKVKIQIISADWLPI